MARVSSCLLIGLCTVANAEEEPPQVQIPQATTRSPLLLEEIVVTARKREENLQQVPVSADVISGEKLVQYNLVSLEAASTIDPSVHISSSGQGGQIFMRGVGSGNLSTFDQSVGVFVDDVYHPHPHFTGATLLDVGTIQVLKGPQSTFFGNNAIAGAFAITSQEPVLAETDVEGSLLYGQFNSYSDQVAVNLPMGENVALRLAAMADGTNGWQQNPFAGQTEPHQRNQAGRASLRWAPEDWDITLKIQKDNNVSHDGFAIADCPPASPFVPAGFCKAALGQGLPTGIASHVNTTLRGQGTDLSTSDYALTVHYHLGNQTITSVSAYSDYSSVQREDAAGLPVDALNILFLDKYKQWSQEIRIASDTNQRVSYLAGLYAQVDRDSGFPNDLSEFFLSPVIASIPPLGALTPFLPLGTTGAFAQEEHSSAAFGSLTWHATQDWALTAGLRATKVIKSAAGPTMYGTATQEFGGIVPLPATLQPLAAAVLGVPQAQSGSNSYTGITPSVVAEYHFSPDLMGYARYDRGWLAGIPLVVTNSVIPSAPVQPETVNSFEVGFKSEWLQGRVRSNVDVFASDYKNLQVTSGRFDNQGNILTFITNAARVRSQGVEWLGEWVPSDHWHVAINTTYLDTHYVSYSNVSDSVSQAYCHQNAGLPGCIAAFGGDPGPLQDLSGKPTPFDPRFSGTLTETYLHDVGAWHFVWENSAYYSTHYNDGNNGVNDPLTVQSGYVRWDTRWSLESALHTWGFDIIARNLSSKRVTTGGVGSTPLPASPGSLIVQEQEPRNISAQVRFRF